jgi:hypothetical protein
MDQCCLVDVPISLNDIYGLVYSILQPQSALSLKDYPFMNRKISSHQERQSVMVDNRHVVYL